MSYRSHRCLSEEEKVDGHAGAEDGEERGEEEGCPRDLAGDPVSGVQLADGADVVDGCADVDDDAEDDEGDSGGGRAPGVTAGGGLAGGLNLADKEAEAGDGETEGHQRDAGADPGEE